MDTPISYTLPPQEIDLASLGADLSTITTIKVDPFDTSKFSALSFQIHQSSPATKLALLTSTTAKDAK